MPRDIHLITANHTTFCGARTPSEWDRTAYTLDGAKALASPSSVICSFCERAWLDPDSATVKVQRGA